MSESTPPALAVRGARGGSVVLLGSAASLAIQLASLLTLSRLLAPEDFGLVAMVTIFVALGNLLRDFGLPLAGLQQRELSQQQASNLFWLSALIAAACATLLIVSTPALVALFNEPRLAAILPPLALSIFLGGLTGQLQVQLARRLKFVALVASDIAGQLLGLGVAIVLAVCGAGYWALVGQTLVAATVTLLYRWVASGWIPLRPRRGHGTQRLFATGATYGVAQLLTFAQSNVDTLIIGAHLGATQLGYYNRAYQLLTAPAGRLLDPLTQVVVTTLNHAKAENRDPDALLYRIQFGVGAFVVWLFAVTAGTAPELVPLVLGDKWSPVVPVFQVLAMGGSVWVLNHVSYWAFIVKERPRALLTYNLVSKPLAVTSILIGAQFGILGVAAGYAVAMAFSWPLNLVWLSRSAGFPGLRFFAGGCRVLLAGLAAGLSSAVVSGLLRFSPLLGIVGGILAGTIAMLGVIVCFPATRKLLKSWTQLLTTSLTRRKADHHAQD